jgi:pantoate--beta-alanine ligase
MRVVGKITELKAAVTAQRKAGRTVGLVPTMGCLHKGHISLIEASGRDNDVTVVSIFVNPAQFGPNEDFNRYPRDLEGDSRKAGDAGADIIFAPSEAEMYPQGYGTYVDLEGITDRMCGRSRPGHFKGVATVVTKLFNIVQPDRAYFGQKDAQQAAVIKKLVRELNMNVEITVCPIVRDKDGLALSSRNVYLNSEERKAALVLSSSLFKAERLINDGERDAYRIRSFIEKEINGEPLADIDYVTVVDAGTLEEIKQLKGAILAAVAVRFGKTRLIDNIVVEVR